jgi:hypothetical protein
MPVFPPVPDPYASLTHAELAAFGIGPSHASNDDDDDEEEANDDEETEDDEYSTWRLHLLRLFSLFGALTTKGEKRFIFICRFSF